MKCPALPSLDPWWLRFQSSIIQTWLPRELIKWRIDLEREEKEHTTETGINRGFNRRNANAANGGDTVVRWKQSKRSTVVLQRNKMLFCNFTDNSNFLFVMYVSLLTCQLRWNIRDLYALAWLWLPCSQQQNKIFKSSWYKLPEASACQVGNLSTRNRKIIQRGPLFISGLPFFLNYICLKH